VRGLPCLVIHLDASAQAQVADFDLTQAHAHEDVGRLQVSMDDVPTVEVHQTQKHLRHEALHVRLRERHAPRVQ
jgi:hypothetical protein